MGNKLAKFCGLAAVLLSIGCAARPVRAQQDTRLATENQTIWTNSDCSSGLLKSPPLMNIGQTTHVVTYSASQTPPLPGPTVYIMGSSDNATFVRLSDAGVGGATLTGYGSYAFLEVWAVGGGTGCTISANYLGSQVSNPSPTGASDSSAYRKLIFPTTSPGTTQSISAFQTPYGNSAGFIVLTGTSIPSGSTISIVTNEGTTLDTFSVTAGSPSTPEIFQVPSVTTSNVAVTYTAGGASAGTLTGEYYFFKPGALESPIGEKSAIVNTASAGPTSIIPLSGGTSIRIVSITLSSGTAEAIDFQQGTGTNCATGNSQLSGLTHLAANTPWIQNFPGGGLVAGPGNAVCIHLSGANQTDGMITYSQY